MATHPSKPSSTNLLAGWAIIVLLGLLARVDSASAGVTTITFEDPPVGLLAPGFYSGLTFSTDAAAMSPQVQAAAGNQFLQLTEPLYLTFASPQQRVKFFAGLPVGYASSPVTLTAYTSTDPASAPVASVSLLITSAAISTPLEVQRMFSADIVMVKIDTTALTVDNLEFESGNPLTTQTLINFDNPELLGQQLSTQYFGVSFATSLANTAFIQAHSDTISPPYVAATTTGELDNPGLLAFWLNPAQAAVRVRVGNPTTGSLTATLRAYSAAYEFGSYYVYTLLGTSQVTFSGLSPITNIVEVDTWPSSYINYVEVEYSNNQWEMIDNLEFAPNNPNPHPDTTPPVITSFTVNGQTGLVNLWRQDPTYVGAATNITVAGTATDDTGVRGLIVCVQNVASSTIVSNSVSPTGAGTSVSFTNGAVLVTPGTNLVWALAIDTSGNVSAPSPVITVVDDFPATAAYSFSPLSGNGGLVIREYGALRPPDDWPIELPPAGQTITVTGTNLHSQVQIWFSGITTGYTPVSPTTVAADGSSAAYAVPNEVFTGLFGTSFPMILMDMWPGDEHEIPPAATYNVVPPTLPFPMLYGFNFPNRPDGADFNEFASALDGDSYVFSLIPNPLDLIYFPVFLGILNLGTPGSCFGMAATCRLYANYTEGFYSGDFVDFGYPTGVFYPIGLAAPSSVGGQYHDGAPPYPINLWGEVRANHGIQLSAQVFERFLGQCFPDDPVARLAEVAANPANYIISMMDGGDGHAVAPYAVVGNRIYVVDSNAPYDWSDPTSFLSAAATNSYIEVNTAANSFTYAPQGWTNITGLYTYPVSIFTTSRGLPLDPLAWIEAAVCGGADPLVSTPDGTKSWGWKADGTMVTNLPGAATFALGSGGGPAHQVLLAVPTNYAALNIVANVRTNSPYTFLAGNAGQVLQCQALDAAPGQTALLSLATLNGQPLAFSYKAPADGVRCVPKLGIRGPSVDAVFQIGGLTLPAGGGFQVSFTPNPQAVLLQNLSPGTLHPLLVYTSTDDPTNGTSLAFGPFDLPAGSTYRLTVAYSPLVPLLTVDLLDPASNNYKTIAVLNGFDTRTRFNPGPDCNQNGTLDAIDIALGTSLDLNGDGVPDECQVPHPVIKNVGINPNGQFNFQVIGQPGFGYIVESSPDLKNWTPVYTNQASANGIMPFADPTQGKSVPANFYRARQAQ